MPEGPIQPLFYPFSGIRALQPGPIYLNQDRPSPRFYPGRTMVPIEGREHLLNQPVAPGAMVPLEALDLPEDVKEYYRSQGIRGLSKAAADSIMRKREPTLNQPRSAPDFGRASDLLQSEPEGLRTFFPPGLDYTISPSPASNVAAAVQHGAVAGATGGLSQAPIPRPRPQGIAAAQDDFSNMIPYGEPEVSYPLPYEGETGNEGEAFRSGAREAVEAEDPRLSVPLAVLAAGFGILGSKSPYGLQAIGEGGLKGVETFAKLDKAEKDALLAKRLTKVKERGAAVDEREADIKDKAQKSVANYQAAVAERLRATTPSEIRESDAKVKNLLAQVQLYAPHAAYYEAQSRAVEDAIKARAEGQSETQQTRRMGLFTTNVAKYRKGIMEGAMQVPQGVDPDEYAERLAMRDTILAERQFGDKSFGSLQTDSSGKKVYVPNR